jgi:hypothetical protein
MKYRCEWRLQGVASSYAGEMEMESYDEDSACRLVQRVIWARDFRDRPVSSIKVRVIQIIQAA